MTIETIPGHPTATANVLADARELVPPEAGRLAVWDGLLGLPEPTTVDGIAAHQRATGVLYATLRELGDDATADEVFAAAIETASTPGTLPEILHALSGVSPAARHGDDEDAIAERNDLIRRARGLGVGYEDLGAHSGLSRAMLHRIVSRGG